MRARSVPEWMSNEMARLTLKLERYKPTGSGYNRIQPIRLSKSVTHMLNNPLPAEQPSSHTPASGVLSPSESEWEEVYPTVRFSNCNSERSEKWKHYRNCSTRLP